MKGLARIAFLAAAAVLLTSAAWADTLELKNGSVVQGQFLGGTQNNIRFMVNGKVELYPVTDVLAITFGTSATPQPGQRAVPGRGPTGTGPAGKGPTGTGPAGQGPSTAQRVTRGTVTVPAGTRLLVRMIDSVDSESNAVGDRFRASLEEDLVVDGAVVAAKGTDVYGRLAEVKEAGRLAGKSELTLELTDIVVGGQLQPVMSSDYEVAGDSRGKDTAKKVGIGAAAGAVIGAIAGGGKGAAIGAGVGAGAGTAVQVLTKGEQVRVPSETLLEFRIEQAFTVRLPAR